MALVQLSDFLDVIPAMLQAPHRPMHCTYDDAAASEAASSTTGRNHRPRGSLPAAPRRGLAAGQAIPPTGFEPVT